MKQSPLLESKPMGLASFGKKPSVVLDDDTIFNACNEHILQLTIDDKRYFLKNHIICIDEININFNDLLQKCAFAEIFYDTPLHDVTYEYNLLDRRWYLVDQGIGYDK